MFWFLVISFAVGIIAMMMFSEDGRGCLGGLIRIIAILLAVTALGAAIIFGVIYLIV